MQTRQPHTSFLDLPREIRDMIYGHVIDDFKQSIAHEDKNNNRRRRKNYWSRPLYMRHAPEDELSPFENPAVYVRQHVPECLQKGLFDAHPILAEELCEELEDCGMTTTLKLSLRRQSKRPRQLMGTWTGLDLPLQIKHTVSKIQFQIPAIFHAGRNSAAPPKAEQGRDYYTVLRIFLDDTAPALFAHLPQLAKIEVSFSNLWNRMVPPGDPPFLVVDFRNIEGLQHYSCGESGPTFPVTGKRLEEWRALSLDFECPVTYVVALLNYMEGDALHLIPWQM